MVVLFCFELKLTLWNNFHLSASSRRSEDVKMLRVALFTEHSWDYKLSIHFVLHK